MSRLEHGCAILTPPKLDVAIKFFRHELEDLVTPGEIASYAEEQCNQELNLVTPTRSSARCWSA